MSKDGENIQQGQSKMLIAMVTIGVLCALMIVLTFEVTLPIIAKNREEALNKAIFKVLPGITRSEAIQYSDEGWTTEFDKDDKEDVVYLGFNEQDEFVGAAIEASGQGYADIIKVLYGYDPITETVVGFYVLETKETPGLGDKIEKDANFLRNFEALETRIDPATGGLKEIIKTVKNGQKQNAWEIDGITGATISSRAVGEILGNSTALWVPRLYKDLETLKSIKK